ncbi:MAG: hypothetical protein H0V20_07880 [Actinobacteria bacterium]|nr:hypothetical protein [Actinomycetota bacterium]
MVNGWVHNLESLEAINQDAATRDVVLRMAGLSRGGRLSTFIRVVNADPELDDYTREWVLDLARNERFLLAADEYLARCRTLH